MSGGWENAQVEKAWVAAPGGREVGGASGIVPLLLLGGVVVTVAAGHSKGLWIDNLHNGLLAPSFAFVGAYVLHQRPRNRCGWVFLATGVVEAVMFLGRQISHDAAPGTSPWWGWLGVWPVAVCLALVTLSVVLFPDGRLPSRAWYPVLGVGAALTAVIALTAALWPVGYESAGVSTPPPFTGPGDGPSVDAWSAVAHTSFAALQTIWLVAVVVRWRSSGPAVRRQLGFVGASVALSLVALAAGLIGWSVPTPGLLAACLVPVAAGWAIVHRQYLATNAAFDWLARRSDSGELPSDLAAAIGRTLDARRVELRAGNATTTRSVGVWPLSSEDSVAMDSSSDQVTIVTVLDPDGRDIGDLVVERHEPLSRHERRLLDGFRSQAALVLDHLALAERVAEGAAAARLERLTERENDVLALMAKGLTNAAICDQLHLSIKTVEPAVSSIFTKLDLPPGSNSNRRVLAVLAFVDGQSAR